MELKDCTREELLYIIKRVSWLDDFHLSLILQEVEFEREKKKFAVVVDDKKKTSGSKIKINKGIKRK